MSKFVSYIVFIGALLSNMHYVAGVVGTDCSDVGLESVLEFNTANTITNTLHQEDGNGELRFRDILGAGEGNFENSIDLVVRRIPNTPYTPGNTDKNGVAKDEEGNPSDFGQINILAKNGTGSFEFCFEKSQTLEKKILDMFYFSFYDFDGTKDSKESIALKSDAFADYTLSEKSELEVTKDEITGYTSFNATHKGNKEDNPTDPHHMTPEQQRRGVVFHIFDTDCFFVKMFSVCKGDSCKKGRNILFSGRANSMVPTCAPSAAPSEVPTPYYGEAPSATPSGAFGDPHIKTWGGQSYDFHGICDLVLFMNPTFDKGIGIDVHIRNERMGIWSFIKTAAIRIGEEKLEISGGRDNDNFLINGVVQNTKNGNGVVGTISGYDIHFTQVSKESRKFIIDLGTNQSNNDVEEIVFTTWNSFVSVKVNNPTKDHFDGSLGLMGSFPSGAMVARDGETVIDNSNEFGEEWQVLNSEPEMFSQHGTEGQNGTCTSPSNVELRRRLQASMVTLEQAEIACDSIKNNMKDLCIFDVIATNEVSSAGAY